MAIRKYQAFISSTYRDLHGERERVTWEVLKIGFIPVGMENFSAMDERGWSTIAKAIDESDYYVVVVAGLYGSVDDKGRSWTQREYEYARERGVPVLAFIRDQHHIPGDMVEKGEAVAKLEAFVAALRKAHHVEEWTTVDDLRAKASVALLKIARVDETEGRERPGWYRGPLGPSLDEMARLSAENRELRGQLAATASKAVRLLQRLRSGAALDIRRHVAGGGMTQSQAIFKKIVEEENALVLANPASPTSDYRFPLDKVDSVLIESDSKATLVMNAF